jgi:serine/threonine-protein kinase SRPK3
MLALSYDLYIDLKLDNILVTIEDQSIIDDFVQLQTEEPMARKVFQDHLVYRSYNLFGLLKLEKSMAIYPTITDFGLAQRGDGDGPLIMPIQPRGYMAPDVLLGTGWSYSADIWNLGLMVMHCPGLYRRGN